MSLSTQMDYMLLPVFLCNYTKLATNSLSVPV